MAGGRLRRYQREPTSPQRVLEFDPSQPAGPSRPVNSVDFARKRDRLPSNSSITQVQPKRPRIENTVFSSVWNSFRNAGRRFWNMFSNRDPRNVITIDDESEAEDDDVIEVTPNNSLFANTSAYSPWSPDRSASKPNVATATRIPILGNAKPMTTPPTELITVDSEDDDDSEEVQVVGEVISPHPANSTATSFSDFARAEVAQALGQRPPDGVASPLLESAPSSPASYLLQNPSSPSPTPDQSASRPHSPDSKSDSDDERFKSPRDRWARTPRNKKLQRFQSPKLNPVVSGNTVTDRLLRDAQNVDEIVNHSAHDVFCRLLQDYGGVKVVEPPKVTHHRVKSTKHVNISEAMDSVMRRLHEGLADAEKRRKAQERMDRWKKRKSAGATWRESSVLSATSGTTDVTSEAESSKLASEKGNQSEKSIQTFP